MLSVQRAGNRLTRAKGGKLMPCGGDVSDKLRILRQVAAEDLLKREQGRHALVFIAGGDQFLYLIGQRIANINGISASIPLT